jgi:Domain of unknown function (DUF929)
VTDPDTTGREPGGTDLAAEELPPSDEVPPSDELPLPEEVPPPEVTPRGPATRFVWGAVAVILVGVVALVTYALTRPPSTPRTVHRPPTPADIVSAVGGVPASVFDSVGVTAPGTGLMVPTVLTGQPQLHAHGKPEVLYVGAEFCPFCAAERWPLVVALSRFGHFSHLSNMQSAPASVFPGVQSFSFVGSSYTSRYVSFTGIELYSGAVDAEGVYTRIATLDPLESLLIARYGTASAAHGSGAGAFPFVDIGNVMVTSTSGFSPEVIVGQSQAAIAADLSQPSEPIGQAVVASANYLTAGICAATGQRPAPTCDDKGVRAAGAALGLE